MTYSQQQMQGILDQNDYLLAMRRRGIRNAVTSPKEAPSDKPGPKPNDPSLAEPDKLPHTAFHGRHEHEHAHGGESHTHRHSHSDDTRHVASDFQHGHDDEDDKTVVTLSRGEREAIWAQEQIRNTPSIQERAAARREAANRLY